MAVLSCMHLELILDWPLPDVCSKKVKLSIPQKVRFENNLWRILKFVLATEYHSDIFSLCGTVFLWCFWPSFNSAPGGADDTGRYFAVVNTYLALCGAVMATYATSIWVTPGRKITMEHVQNATLAGGVAMGSAASMPVQPFAALLIGSIAGIVSVLGYSLVKVS